MGNLRTTGLLAVTAISLVLAPVACSSESDDDPSADPDGTEAPAATDGDDGAGDDEDDGGRDRDGGDGGGSDDGEGDDGDEAEPLGSATARLPAAPNDETLVPLRLEVTGLERLDGMVELRVALANEGESSTPDFQPYSSFDDPRLPTGDGLYSVSGASLVDAGAERAYLTIVDSEGTCLCTGRLSQVAVAAGESFDMYADFGGVPDDLEEVDVQVPGFPTIDGVPIE